MEVKPSIAPLGMKGDGLSCHEPLEALVEQWKWFVIAGIHLLINFPLLVLSLIRWPSSASLWCSRWGKAAQCFRDLCSIVVLKKSFLVHFSVDGVTDVPIY